MNEKKESGQNENKKWVLQKKVSRKGTVPNDPLSVSSVGGGHFRSI